MKKSKLIFLKTTKRSEFAESRNWLPTYFIYGALNFKNNSQDLDLKRLFIPYPQNGIGQILLAFYSARHEDLEPTFSVCKKRKKNCQLFWSLLVELCDCFFKGMVGTVTCSPWGRWWPRSRGRCPSSSPTPTTSGLIRLTSEISHCWLLFYLKTAHFQYIWR